MVDLKAGMTTNDHQVDFAALLPGEKVGRYEILSVLGHGGFGITYRAQDSQLGSDVAIKEYLPVSLAIRQSGNTVLPRSTKVAEDFVWGRERFVAEGRTLATLHHAPGIVRMLDFLEINGTAYIVMELLHGDTLEGHLKKFGRLKPDATDRILWTLLDGLEEVHNAGFLHRDIKPANILLDGAGYPTLIDFGSSRAAMAGRTVTMTAVFTPGYAAAEQFTATRQGPWTDIYGLAATLYQTISGTMPPNAFDRLLEDAYEPLARYAGPGFSPGLLAGIDAGLAIRSSDRPQTIGSWRPLLSMTTTPAEAVTVLAPRSPRPAQKSTRKRWPLYAGVTAAALVIAGGGYFTLLPKPPASTAMQDLKVEDLERLLAERRKADVDARDKKRLEEEARRKVEADAAAKMAADAEFREAQTKRQKAEDEMAKRMAETAQRMQVDAAAAEAQRKAEADMAALRQAEEDARKKAEAEADTKRQADEALAIAQLERQKADQEAAARARAEEEATSRAAEEAKQKSNAEAAAVERKTAETTEAALRLATLDRQRLQVALTSLGFDTRGTDGAFGPRSREMITGWQKARNQPATGFLTGPQQQALLREAAPSLSKYDEELKKIEDAKKKVEEEKKKADEEARAKATAAASQPATATATAATPAGKFDGRYSGPFVFAGNMASYGAAFGRTVSVSVLNGTGTGRLNSAHCGAAPISFSISPSGDITGQGAGFDLDCGKHTQSIRGRASNGRLELTFDGIPAGHGRATLAATP